MAATTVDTLLVKIEADLSSLKRQLAQSQAATQRTAGRMQGAFRKMEASVGLLVARFGNLRTGILAVGAVIATGLGMGIARTNAQFQDLEVTLSTVFGGMEEGQAAMEFIQIFAQRTPFDIQTLSKAFIQLGGAGIKPTEELLTTFGDAAAATTNRVASFEAMVRIATRAVGGGLGLEELEQLVNQGIPVYKILQREINVSRQEISELGQTAEGAAKIMEGLQRGLQKDFGGGMAKAAHNLSVMMSNLGIAATNLTLALGEGIGGVGLTVAFTFLAETLTQFAVILKPVVHLLGVVLAGAVAAVVLPFRLLSEAILLVARGLVELGKFVGQFEGFEFIADAANSLNASLDDLAAKMNKNIKGLKDTGKSSEEADKKIVTLKGDIQHLKDQLANMPEVYLKANEMTRGFNDMNAEQLQIITDLIAEHDKLTKQLDAKTKATTDATKKDDDLKKIVSDLTFENEQMVKANLGVSESTLQYQEILRAFGGDLGEHTTKIKTLIREQHEIRKAQEKSEKAQEEYNERIEEGTQLAAAYIPQQQILEENLRKIEDAFYAGEIAQDAFNAASADIDMQIKRLNPEFRRLHDAALKAADGVSNALADAFVNGKFSLQSLGDVFKQVIKQMIADAIKAQIIKHILGPIFGAMGIPMAGGGGAVGSGSTANTFVSASDSFASGGRISRRATGGPVMVGERGPELFIPHSAGVIRNNHDTMNMMGGATQPVVNQTINIDAGVSQTVRAEVISMMPRIKQETIAAMMDGKRRGTSISKVF
jgi:hypothetical protein